MSYIAVDTFGEVPKGTAKALYNANLMTDCKIPLYKRNMNWGDNPIQL